MIQGRRKHTFVQFVIYIVVILKEWSASPWMGRLDEQEGEMNPDRFFL